MADPRPISPARFTKDMPEGEGAGPGAPETQEPLQGRPSTRPVAADERSHDPRTPEGGDRARATPGVPPHRRGRDDGRDIRDEELEQSFPASDPPATGGPGI